MHNENLNKLLENYQQLRDQLQQMLDSYKFGRQLRVVMSCGFWALVSFFMLLLIFMLAERTPLQSETVRWLHALVLYWLLAWWLIKAFRAVIHPPPSTGLAVEIESTTGKFTSGLSSAIEFCDATRPAADDRTSETMRRITIAQVAQQLQQEDISHSLKAFSRRRSAFTMMFFMVLGVLWYVLSPVEVVTGAGRLLFPMRAIAPYSTLEILVEPEHALVAMGESLEISAKPSRQTSEPIILELFEPDKLEGNRVEMYPDATASESRFVYPLNSLQESVDYRITCEKFSTLRYSIKVMPRPQVKSLQMTLFQPGYIATQPVKLPENTGDASVLTGSRVKIEVTADQNLASGAVILIPGATQSCEISERTRFIYEMEIATNTGFSIFLENEMGLRNEKPVLYTITAAHDSPPTVELLKPAQDVPFPTSRRLDIKAVSRDDYGVKATILFYKVGDRDALIPQNLKPDFKPVPEYEVEFPWMLDTLALQPGTKISYFVQAEDARQPKPNIASTALYFINMPSMYDIYRGEEMSQGEVNQKMEEFIEAQKMRREALMKAYEQIKHEEKLDFEASQSIEKAIEQGTKSQQEAQEILESFQKLQENMENNPLSSPEALERMQKVSELLNEVLDDETKRMMEQLRESLKDLKLDPKDIEKYEEAFKMDDYLKGLDRTIDLLTQVREQQKFNALALAIEDLNRRQQQIASETAALKEKMAKEGLTGEEESQLKDLADQQEKIGQELEQLQKQSEEMTKNRKSDEFQQNPMLEDVKNIRDRMQKENYQQRSEDIKKDMKQKNLDSAQQNQQNMLKFLDALKKDSEQISQQCSGGAAPQIDLSAFIRRALRVSHDQEMLFKEIIDLPEQFMRGQRPEIEGLIDQVSVLQVLVKQQGSELANDLEQYVRSSFAVDPSAIEPIQGTQAIFADIVKNLEDRALSISRADQLEIVRRFNQLAIELMRAQDQSGSSGSANPMDALQQFKDLTRRQLSLYQQMMQRQMSPQSQQTMEALQRMAMEQRQVREALEKLMRESRQQMNSLGRLDDVIDEMKDLETEILDPELRKKVAEKQKSIYDRMLRAQKAIKDRDEESEERKARQAEVIKQQQPDKPLGEVGTDTRDLSRDFLGDLKEEFPESYKPMLNDYFKSLNIYGGN
ncbi:MAG: chromosome segregation ATPase-like protein [uncultured bacterium]|nr:MAG: chromosome segregation ATPase-like protein [uncultured bacterium]